MKKMEIAKEKINSEGDFLDFLGNADTNLVIIPDNMLSEDFFDLKTGLAGAILQKIVNYSVRAAFVIGPERKLNERFSELVKEMNKGNDIRFFENIEQAKTWLVSFPS
jgi:hypothetical protein